MNVGKLKLAVAAIVAVVALHFILSIIGVSEVYSFPVNNALNSVVPINNSCTVDEDCKMAAVDCSVCAISSKGGAVNKNFNPFCPIPEIGAICATALPKWETCFKAVCENKKCVKQLNGEVFQRLALPDSFKEMCKNA
ncbi:MAG TPA: hypothetical protein VFF09_05220 [archaeon]|nr:hypothetical protein [archaeon]